MLYPCVFSLKSIFVVSAVIIVTLAFVFPWNQDCYGSASCISGNVTNVIDGDTIEVNGKPIRIALVSAPELDQVGGLDAKEFVTSICPVGSPVLVDEDDGQIEGSYDRMIAMIHCRGKILNEEVIENDHGVISSQFCSVSEFSEMTWASENGC